VKRRRSLAAASSLALLATAACRAPLDARPIEIPEAARASYEDALRRRAAAPDLGGDDARAELEAALSSAKEALAVAPDEFRFAVLVQDLEFDLDARAARERYTSTAPATARDRTLAARALLPERSAEARDLLLDASRGEPGFAWARYGLAFVERNEGQATAAIADAEQALKLDPTLIEALRLLADLYQSGGDRKRALLAREELIEVTNGDLGERHRYARLLLESDSKSDASDAERQLRVILAAVGDPPAPAQLEFARDALLDLGTCFARRADKNRNPKALEEAIAAWRRALALDPWCLTALYNIGLVERDQRNDPRAALAAFEEYLSRAESMSGPLPSDQLISRYLAVPDNVMTLREQLGLPQEPP
jgi:tetratricopeptide (TPR) repeat protein